MLILELNGKMFNKMCKKENENDSYHIIIDKLKFFFFKKFAVLNLFYSQKHIHCTSFIFTIKI